MKKIAVLILLFIFLLAGCGKEENTVGADGTQTDDKNGTITEQGSTNETESDETESGTSGELVSELGTEDTDEAGEIRELTVEDVRELAEKHGELSLEDFAPYVDVSALSENGSLSELLEFSYNGEKLYLRLYATDKEVVAATYEGELDSAIIFHEEFLELNTIEQEYAYEGSCADIRSGDLEHILDGTVEMEDYLTLSLPEGLTQSGYKYWLGSRGGVSFLRDGETEEMMPENAGIYAQQPMAGGIDIWGSGEVAQNMEVVQEYETLQIEDMMLKRELVQTEQGTKWYMAYTDQEGSSISYYIYLNESEYTEGDFFAMTDSVVLEEYAVY